MNWQKNLQLWKDKKNLDIKLQKELDSIDDENELKNRFSTYSSFGTGGIRSKMGVGTSRLNYYTIARATMGLANYIVINHEENKGVVISYDTRHYSREFAVISANTLLKKGIKVYLCDHVTPTPELSFLVRHFNAGQGIMITASHNPAAYNGYKVYDSDGGQVTLEDANKIGQEIDKCKDYLDYSININLVNNNLLTILDNDIEKLYLNELRQVTRNPGMIRNHGSEIKIVYTPLHGTGKKLVTEGLANAGFTNVILVPQQAVPDPDFSTVKYPNPEFSSAFDLAIRTGKKENADILIATDPDADRLGVAVKNLDGNYKLLSGNQLGAIMIDYLGKNLSQTDPNKYQIIKTIVTSDFGANIAQYHNFNVRETLTGFKFIGEQIERIEDAHDSTKYLFGYEESYGYLIAPFVRDKDSIQAALLTAEIALNLKLRDSSLLKHLDELYEQFGYYDEKLITKTFTSTEEAQKLIGQIDKLRNDYPTKIGDFAVDKVQDFEKSEEFALIEKNNRKLKLPKSNVLKIILKNGSWLAIRPSGTEPKIKLYISSVGKTKHQTREIMSVVEKFANNLIE